VKPFLFLAAALLLQDQAPVFRSEVNLVVLNVRVTEKGDRDVSGLKATDFTLLENGRPQRIAVFGAEEQPVTLGILLDTSGSMRGAKIALAKAALGPLVAAGHPDNQILYQEFSNHVSKMVEINGENRRLPEAIAEVTANANADRSSTAFYDALAIALCRLRNARYSRQALLVITDGADQNSRIRLDETIRLVRSSPAQVFFVGYFTGRESMIFGRGERTARLVTGRDIDNPFQVFKRLAQESGTESFFPKNDGDVRKAIEAIGGVLRAQYTLAYYPESAPDPWRKIDVKLNRGGVQVRTRRGISTENAAAMLFHADSCDISPEQRPYPYELKTELREGLRVYHDDFQDASSGWPVNLEKGGRRSYQPQGYELALSKAQGLMAGDGIVSGYGPWWTDFRATLKFTSSSGAAAGLVFRMGDTGFFALLIDVRKIETYYKVVRRDYQSEQTLDLTQWTRSPMALRPGADMNQRTIAAECRGLSCKLFLEGHELTTISDNMSGEGLVGVAIYGLGRANFEDLLVEELR